MTIIGETRTWSVEGYNGRADFRFCPIYGATVAYATQSLPGLTAIPLGTFADPMFPPPHYSVYEARKYPWVAVRSNRIEHFE